MKYAVYPSTSGHAPTVQTHPSYPDLSGHWICIWMTGVPDNMIWDPRFRKKIHVIERGVGCVIMGVMWWILTYDVNFILKLFTNHLCLYVISLQVIINQRVLANPVKYNFVWRVKSLTMPIDCWCRHLAKSKFQVAKFSPGERIIF